MEEFRTSSQYHAHLATAIVYTLLAVAVLVAAWALRKGGPKRYRRCAWRTVVVVGIIWLVSSFGSLWPIVGAKPASA